MDSSTQRGYVYILTNDRLPGLVKIGMTMRNPFQRATELRSTGMPTNFNVAAAIFVDNPKQIESQLHRIFDSVRVERDREFFEIDCNSVLSALVELIIQNPNVSPTLDFTDPLKWELNLSWSSFLKRNLDEHIDTRLEIANDKGYLERLWLQAIEGDEKSQNEIIFLEESGSKSAHDLILNALLTGEVKTNVSDLLIGIVLHAPHQIPDYIKRYPNHNQGFGDAYLKIIDLLYLRDKGTIWLSWRDPSCLSIFLYSRDVILAEGLDPESFARQLGRNLDLSQYIANSLSEVLQRPWTVKEFIGQDPLMQERITTMEELLDILAVRPKKN